MIYSTPVPDLYMAVYTWCLLLPIVRLFFYRIQVYPWECSSGPLKILVRKKSRCQSCSRSKTARGVRRTKRAAITTNPSYARVCLVKSDCRISQVRRIGRQRRQHMRASSMPMRPLHHKKLQERWMQTRSMLFMMCLVYCFIIHTQEGISRLLLLQSTSQR